MVLGGEQEILKSVIISFVFDTFISFVFDTFKKTGITMFDKHCKLLLVDGISSLIKPMMAVSSANLIRGHKGSLDLQSEVYRVSSIN